jgi:glycosyltransferase involved in cell wall biosynthesis
LKICFIVLEAAPLNGKDMFIGGTVNNVISLSKGLVKRGHNIHILTSDVSGRQRKIIRTPWSIIHPFPVFGKYGTTGYVGEVAAKLLFQTVRVNSKEKFDIINIHTGYSALVLLASIISKVTHVPVIFTLYSSARGTGVFGKLYSIIEKITKRSGIAITIVVSEAIKKDLQKRGISTENIVCIPPTFDPDRFNPTLSKKKARQKLALDDSYTYILYVGSWAPAKGVEPLIQGIKEVLRTFPQVKLILALAGIEKNDEGKRKITNLITKEGLEKSVVYFGLVPDVGQLMTASDIVVVPYLTTLGIADRPLAVIEAMACGRPVVASRVGAIEELIEDHVNGLLVNPKQPLEIDRSLRFLLMNKKEADAMGALAAQYIYHVESVDSIIRLTETVYQDFK